MNRFIALYRSDLKNIKNDPILIYSILILPIIMVIFRLFREQIPSEQLYAVAVLFVMALGPVIFGMLPAFILLDEKDEKTLDAIRVLPISPSTFLSYRMINWVGLVFIYSLAAPVIMDFSGIPTNALVLCALLLTLETPIIALIIMTYADNKVEGIVATKIVNAVFLAPFLAYIASPKWTNLLVPIPSYWAIKGFMEATLGNEFMGFIMIGAVYYTGILFVLMWLFKREVL